MIGLFTFAGCVKDNILSPASGQQALSRKSLNFTGFILPESNTMKYGTITGIILPPDAKGRVFLFSNASTIELDLDDKDGSIKKSDVPVGEYSVYVQPENLNYYDYMIEGIIVNPNLSTDIGTITLQYAGWGGGGCEIGWGRSKQGK